MKAFVSLSEVVDEYLNEVGNYDQSNKKRFMQIVLRGYTNLNIKHAIQIKPFMGTVNSANILVLPGDFVDYVRMGVYRDGLIYPMSENRAIMPAVNEICAQEQVSDANLQKLYIPYTHKATLGGGYSDAQFSVDYFNKKITFRGSLSNDQVAILYVSSSVSRDGIVLIPVELIEVLKDYLEWTIKKRDPNIPENKVYRYYKQYISSRNEYLRLRSGFTFYELMDAITSGWSKGVK